MSMAERICGRKRPVRVVSGFRLLVLSRNARVAGRQAQVLKLGGERELTKVGTDTGE
jgi:hypothetical protein